MQPKCEGYCGGNAEGYTFPRLFTELEKGPKQYCKECYYSIYGCKVSINMQLKYKKLDPSAIPPQKDKVDNAGYDLYALEETVVPSFINTVRKYIGHLISNTPWRFFAGDTFNDSTIGTKIPTGIALEIPTGYFGQINDRSGLGSKGLKVMGGQIDSNYRGDVTVCLMNFSFFDKVVTKGDRIAQIMILPVASPELVEIQELSLSERNANGFGSSGFGKEFHE